MRKRRAADWKNSHASSLRTFGAVGIEKPLSFFRASLMSFRALSSNTRSFATEPIAPDDEPARAERLDHC